MRKHQSATFHFFNFPTQKCPIFLHISHLYSHSILFVNPLIASATSLTFKPGPAEYSSSFFSTDICHFPLHSSCVLSISAISYPRQSLSLPAASFIFALKYAPLTSVDNRGHSSRIWPTISMSPGPSAGQNVPAYPADQLSKHGGR